MAQDGKDVDAYTMSILSGTRLVEIDEFKFARNISEIVFDRSKRWIFLPHVNLSDRPSEQIFERTQLKNMLSTEARKNHCEFFDPTSVVIQSGRSKALDAKGADFHHYAPAFLPIMGEAIYQIIAAPRS